MTIRWSSLLSLKAYVLVAILVVWNGGILFAHYQEGDAMLEKMATDGNTTIGMAALIVSVFLIGVAYSKGMQTMFIAPTRLSNFRTQDFYATAIICAIFSAITFVGPFG